MAVLWTAIVTYFCLVNMNDLPKVNVGGYDKIGHLTFHFGLTVLWFLYFYFQKTLAKEKALISAVLFSFLYGVGIELIQTFFTTSRSGDVMDVLANFIGSLMGVAVVTLYANKNKN